MHVFVCFVAEISASSDWCLRLNNSSVLSLLCSGLRLLNCDLDYFIKHSFILFAAVFCQEQISQNFGYLFWKPLFQPAGPREKGALGEAACLLVS